MPAETFPRCLVRVNSLCEGGRREGYEGGHEGYQFRVTAHCDVSTDATGTLIQRARVSGPDISDGLASTDLDGRPPALLTEAG